MKCEHKVLHITFNIILLGEDLQVYGLPWGRLPGLSVISLAAIWNQRLAAILFQKKYWHGREQSSALYARNWCPTKAIKFHLVRGWLAPSQPTLIHFTCSQCWCFLSPTWESFLWCSKASWFLFCYGRDLVPVFFLCRNTSGLYQNVDYIFNCELQLKYWFTYSIYRLQFSLCILLLVRLYFGSYCSHDSWGASERKISDWYTPD